MAGRDMEALALGIAEAVDDHHIHSRVEQVQYLGAIMLDWGIPIVQPVGGHAIFLDARSFYPHISQDEFPAQVLASQLYLDSGIRGMERGVVSAGSPGGSTPNLTWMLSLKRRKRSSITVRKP
jgi:tyrosine phenol-lyase